MSLFRELLHINKYQLGGLSNTQLLEIDFGIGDLGSSSFEIEHLDPSPSMNSRPTTVHTSNHHLLYFFSSNVADESTTWDARQECTRVADASKIIRTLMTFLATDIHPAPRKRASAEAHLAIVAVLEHHAGDHD